MEAKTVSKKREQPSVSSSKSHPLTAISTRSKYQALLHRSRSGRTRPDPTFTKKPHLRQLHFPDLPWFETPTSIGYDQEPSIDDDLLCNLIKDLRSKRVFSPDSKVRYGFDCVGLNDDETVVKNGGSERLSSGFSLQGVNVDEIEAGQSEKIEKADLGIPNAVSPGMEFSAGIVESANRNWVGNSVDEAEQKTQPTCVEVRDSCKNETEKVSSYNDPNHECVGEGFSRNDNDKAVSDSKTKLVLRPCFRRKVFKTPGSVSYRRLLPYLMEVTENNSGSHENGRQQKLEFGSGERKLPAVLASKRDKGEASIGRLNSDIVPVKSYALLKPLLDSTHESPVCNELNLMSPMNILESPSSGIGADVCLLKPSQKRKSGNFDLQLSCKDNMINNLNNCSIAEDINAVEYAELKKSDGGFTSKVQNGGIANLTSSCIFKDVHMGEHHEPDRYFEDTKLFDHAGTENVDTRYPCKVQKLNDSKESEYYDGALNPMDDLNEESMQMTPPDEIIARLGTVENEVRPKNMLHRDHDVEKQTNRIKDRNNNDKGCDSSPKGKLGLNPHSRLKLFRSPGSFSYRRLLPHLLDIMKDNSCSLTGHFPKPKKNPEEVSLSPSHASDAKEMSLDESHTSVMHTNCQTSDSDALPASTKTTTSVLSDDNEPSPIYPEHSAESEMAMDSENEDLLRVEEAVSDKPGQMKNSPDNFTSVQGADPLSLSTIKFEAPYKAENVTPLPGQSTVEIDGTTSGLNIEYSNCTKFIEADSFSQRSSHLEVPVSSGFLAIGAGNGILKRNPRGCRGLCSCLNCASFRLHAERAFEFSKNQMQDAEEVALDLIKELSYLRNTLEKSADDADNHNLVDANKVKEICKKAYETEELAKCRLSQMNCDLSIHCKITTLQRPRVRFANYVEEKVIPKETFLGSLQLRE